MSPPLEANGCCCVLSGNLLSCFTNPIQTVSTRLWRKWKRSLLLSVLSLPQTLLHTYTHTHIISIYISLYLFLFLSLCLFLFPSLPLPFQWQLTSTTVQSGHQRSIWTAARALYNPIKIKSWHRSDRCRKFAAASTAAAGVVANFLCFSLKKKKIIHF